MPTTFGRRLLMCLLLTDRTTDRMTERTITQPRQPWRSNERLTLAMESYCQRHPVSVSSCPRNSNKHHSYINTSSSHHIKSFLVHLYIAPSSQCNVSQHATVESIYVIRDCVRSITHARKLVSK